MLAALRSDIMTGALLPGDQVVQETLADRYGVSRVPLREALKALETEGQVVYYPHRGYFVAELSVADLLEVYRLRATLEAVAIRDAVPTLTDDDVDALEELLEGVEAASGAGDVIALTAANRLPLRHPRRRRAAPALADPAAPVGGHGRLPGPVLPGRGQPGSGRGRAPADAGRAAAGTPIASYACTTSTASTRSPRCVPSESGRSGP